jgi:protease I
MKLTGKRIGILVEDLYNDREVWYPYYRMKEEGAEVICIGPKKNVYKGKNEIPIQADLSIDETNVEDFDAVVIPGGFAPDLMRRTPAIAAFVGEMNKKGKIIASICHGGWILVSAGILRGKTVTSYFAIKDDITNAGAKWVDEEVVRDGNIITSRMPDDLPAFCRTMIELLT